MLAGFGRWGPMAAAIALAGTLAAWGAGGGAMFSPGALHAGDSTATVLGGVESHARLARRCDACHAPPWSRETMGGRCLDCHTDVQAELRDSTSLHGGAPDVRRCLDCHTEHGGPSASLTRFEGGVAHDRFGFALAAHERTSAGRPFVCRDCHAAETFRFERARCLDCHRDEQPELMARHVDEYGDDCLACHDGRDRFSRGAFDHGAVRFPLTGAHRRAACVACHRGTRTLADFRAAPTTCVECHRDDDEHRGGFGADCGACHSTDGWEGARFEHDFPLDHGGEGPIACATCHEERGSWKSYTCYGCHEHSPARVRAKHAEEGIGGAELDDCVRCHATGREHEGRGRGDGERRRRGDRERDEH